MLELRVNLLWPRTAARQEAHGEISDLSFGVGRLLIYLGLAVALLTLAAARAKASTSLGDDSFGVELGPPMEARRPRSVHVLLETLNEGNSSRRVTTLADSKSPRPGFFPFSVFNTGATTKVRLRLLRVGRI
jgi:hypothetical protein